MNTTKPLISVMMPVHDRAHLVKQALVSIFDQTFKDFEIVVVDDGSTDGTWKILKEFADESSKMKLFRFPKQRGISEALLQGNELCSGEIIVKQDSDDLSLPDRLEKIKDYFEKNPDTEFFYHGMYQIYLTDSPKNKKRYPDIVRKLYYPAVPIEKNRILKEQYIPGVFAYTKKFSQEVPYRQLHCSDDWMLILDAYFKGKKIGFLNEGLYEYYLRDDSNSMIHEGTGNYEEDEETMRNILEEEYQVKGFKYAPRK